MSALTKYICSNAYRNYHAIEKYSDKLQNISNMSLLEVDNYIDTSLDELLQYVYENNAYYREKLNSIGYSPEEEFSREIFEKIETLSKDTLREDKDIVLCVPKKDIVHIHTSTGTLGGENIYVMYTMGDLYGSIWFRRSEDYLR
ncbi:hypothetical protein I5677_05910 [Mobilitalea sibirica]|uniref:Uncharacterized protein n=1 Tax=Mobilitalea sibirica TaxID=1462919 RepID=A0A8J7HBX1_9FIRM|nr:hypothetical protein [Mobilitalea sibirica]MBH1940432.1 hypothetical protein [Mobilitalea sibirica]